MTALAPLVSHHEVTWIASALSDEDRRSPPRAPSRRRRATARATGCGSSPTEPSAYDLYYNVVANPALWFVQHGLWGLKHDPDDDLGCAWEEGYVAVNQAFADAVLEELDRQPAATVFFHDYHLYVAPRARPRAAARGLARSLHPHSLGGRRGLVGAARPDRDARSTAGCSPTTSSASTPSAGGARFSRPCSSLGLDTGGALVTAHPISIDPDEFAGLAQSDAVLARERELVASRPETMILRVDRTDPSKNVVRGLEAFGLLLERRPDLRGRVGMLALLDPSRQEIPEYVEELRRDPGGGGGARGRAFPGALELRGRGRLSRSRSRRTSSSTCCS